ncbi:MAG: Uncharacterised protein [Owenweeksia sp. TMED14]|nr:MAG: Uncharacterised protein [Owenweeksia sp. TMED14]|tara:strand:- start:303 stop:719 length:417 start_codon:yes stop_codon:yes gene_type:complete
MGLYNLSYKNDEADELINTEVGRSYTLFKKLRLGGVGSRRMIVEDFSENLNHLKLQVSGLQYGSIEIRPKGILVHINLGLDTYAWTIPFFRLSVFNGDFFTIHGNGDYIQFNKEKSWKENHTFLQKIIHLKSEFNPMK